jgi:hypothetical protein
VRHRLEEAAGSKLLVIMKTRANFLLGGAHGVMPCREAWQAFYPEAKVVEAGTAAP